MTTIPLQSLATADLHHGDPALATSGVHPTTVADDERHHLANVATCNATGRVLDAVSRERVRQERIAEAKRREGARHWRTCADPLLPDDRRLPILAEELGEVAKALNDAYVGEPANLREELIHVAACAVAWAEYLGELAAGTVT